MITLVCNVCHTPQRWAPVNSRHQVARRGMN
jgi:hypothetical protein